MSDDAIPEGCPCCGALPVDWVNNPCTPAASSDERHGAREVVVVETIETRPATWPFDDSETPPIYRVRIGNHCADFDYEQAARSFADAIIAALAANRPTDAGAGLLRKLDAIKQAVRYEPIGDDYFDLYDDAAEAVDAAVDRLAAGIADVHNAMRERCARVAASLSHELFIPFQAGPGEGIDDVVQRVTPLIAAAIRNLTGDGAGA